jgi:hypothetical protein
MALHFNHTVCHSHPSDDSGWLSPMIGPSILHFGDVNMTSAVLEGVFNGFLRAVYVEPVDSQKQTAQRSMRADESLALSKI